MDNIRIRQAQLGDIDNLLTWGYALHQVEKQFEPFPKYSATEVKERYARMLDDPNCLFLIAEFNEKAVGYLYAHLNILDYLESDRPICEIEVVFVEITARGHGLAQKLISTAIEWAKKNNCVEVRSGVYTDNNCSRKVSMKAGFTEKHITYSIGLS